MSNSEGQTPVNSEFARYTAVWLDDSSRELLLAQFPLPTGWEAIATHMTISLSPIEKSPASALVGKRATLQAIAAAANERVAAVRVLTNLPCINDVPHVTLGVNRITGGEAKHSNELKGWQAFAPLVITGIVCEISRSARRPMGI